MNTKKQLQQHKANKTAPKRSKLIAMPPQQKQTEKSKLRSIELFHTTYYNEQDKAYTAKLKYQIVKMINTCHLHLLK